MKLTIPTLLLLMAVGCSWSPTTPMIVTCVEIYGNKKYDITVNGMTTIYTDSLYQVGDTIK
jgi:hypothetical protein